MNAMRKPRVLDKARLRRSLGAYMLEQGLHSTKQRQLIIDTFFAAEGHVTVEGLHKQVQEADARISYATVYRTMKLFAESGVAQTHSFGDGFTRYELADADTHHDHLVCVHCGKITEFAEPQIELLQAKVARRYGFLVRAHKHEMYGTCADCQSNGRTIV
jgi:Fur family transcriptional regulator, ferric uptake regulator